MPLTWFLFFWFFRLFKFTCFAWCVKRDVSPLNTFLCWWVLGCGQKTAVRGTLGGSLSALWAAGSPGPGSCTVTTAPALSSCRAWGQLWEGAAVPEPPGAVWQGSITHATPPCERLLLHLGGLMYSSLCTRWLLCYRSRLPRRGGLLWALASAQGGALPPSVTGHTLMFDRHIIPATAAFFRTLFTSYQPAPSNSHSLWH